MPGAIQPWRNFLNVFAASPSLPIHSKRCRSRKCAERVAPARHAGRHPLFGVMILAPQNAPASIPFLPGLWIEPQEIDTEVGEV